MSEDREAFRFEIKETSAGAYLVTGRDRQGRSVVLRSPDPDPLRAECQRWLEEHSRDEQ